MTECGAQGRLALRPSTRTPVVDLGHTLNHQRLVFIEAVTQISLSLGCPSQWVTGHVSASGDDPLTLNPDHLVDTRTPQETNWFQAGHLLSNITALKGRHNLCVLLI